MSRPSIPAKIIDSAWAQGCAFWGATLDIARPTDIAKLKGGSSIAYIEMDTRQVNYNSSWFLERDILDCFPAVFAHELAHHMRYPHTLKVSAELMLMGNRICPGLSWSMINLFLDLLVNEHVGRDPELRRELIRLYTAIAQESKDDLYCAYLCVYESLWFGEADFGLKLSDSDRALIRGFTDAFYQLPNIYEQFIYFLLFFQRNYNVPASGRYDADPLTGDARLPTVEDFPVDGSWTKSMQDAYAKAAKEGWGDAVKNGGLPTSERQFADLASVMRGLAGKGQPDAPQKAALRYYRLLVERALEELPLRLPAEKEPLEIPSAAEDWELGDDPRSIDWLESVLHSGGMASAVPLKREQLVEPSSQMTEMDLGIPDFEIYLDTSGSMPNPTGAVNAMTLAALVLATYAVRKGGRVYGVVYSSGKPIISTDWMLEEPAVQAFFLNYFGGGTDYPFDILKKRQEQFPGVYRIIISDRDFVSNITADAGQGKKAKDGGNIKLTLEAAARSKVLVLLLLQVRKEDMKAAKLGPLLNHPQIRFVPVMDQSKFAAMAAKLAQALLGTL